MECLKDKKYCKKYIVERIKSYQNTIFITGSDLQTERNLSRKLTARVNTSGLVEWARAVSVHTESIQSVTMNLGSNKYKMCSFMINMCTSCAA